MEQPVELQRLELLQQLALEQEQAPVQVPELLPPVKVLVLELAQVLPRQEL
jgi:hypothetical protein